MNLGRLLALAIAVPTLGVVAITASSYIPHRAGLLSHSQEHLFLAIALVAGIIPFSLLMIGLFGRIQRHIVSQNEELSKRNREAEALLKIGLAVEQSREPGRVLATALEAVVEATTASAAEIWLPDRNRQVLTRRHHCGESEKAFGALTQLRFGHGLPGVAASSGDPVIVHDLPGDARFLRRDVVDAGFRTYCAFPMVGSDRQVVGVLGVAAKARDALTAPEEHRLLRLISDRLAAAVENAALSEQLQTFATLAERERIAMEMHDGLAQVLGYVNTKAQAVKELLLSGDVEAAIKQMDQLETSARDTYDDVREAILALGADGQRRPLVDGIRDYVSNYSDLSGIDVTFEVSGIGPNLTPREEVQLIRIVQEALANVRKHAGAGSARILLAGTPAGWKLSVADDGLGFEPERLERGTWPHFGLHSMRERSATIGAKFTLESSPGAGTRIIVEKTNVANG